MNAHPLVRPNEKTFSSDLDTGITKREYFAALALQGITANSSAYGSAAKFAEYSVKQADALIEALNKETPTT